jgi:hypothetical protein
MVINGFLSVGVVFMAEDFSALPHVVGHFSYHLGLFTNV